MITYKLSDLREKYMTETEDGMTYVYCQNTRIGILEGDIVTIPKYMINAGVLELLEGAPYEIARLVFIVQEIDDLLGVYPVKYFTVASKEPFAVEKAIKKAFAPYCGDEVSIGCHWLLWEGVPEYGYYLDYAVLDEF